MRREMRAPQIVRLSTSRPSLSVPKGCVRVGAGRLLTSFGIWEAVLASETEHPGHTPCAGCMHLLQWQFARDFLCQFSSLSVVYPRVEPRVSDIDEKVGNNVDRGEEKDHALHDEEISADDGFENIH